MTIWTKRSPPTRRDDALSTALAPGGTLLPRFAIDARLTQREYEILEMIGRRLTDREIAEALFLSPKTVEFHLTSVYRKLDLTSRRELIRAVATGGIDPRVGVTAAE